MARVIWSGAISFGLVHIPVSLMPATIQRGVDFDWLDKRSMEPVGYRRINKVTGKEIDGENIVRGVKYEKNRYVVLSEDEIRAAYPKATRTIDILDFVEAAQIDLLYMDTPYFVSPENRGEKAYVLLRKALEKSGRVALCNVVMHSKQHLAAILPLEGILILNTLRWNAEVRALDDLGLRNEALEMNVSARELEMAMRLIADMSDDWEPTRYRDNFTEQIMALVERKAKQGKVESVGPFETDEGGTEGAEIIDLTEMLKRSLGKSPKPPQRNTVTKSNRRTRPTGKRKQAGS